MLLPLSKENGTYQSRPDSRLGVHTEDLVIFQFVPFSLGRKPGAFAEVVSANIPPKGLAGLRRAGVA